MLVRRIFSVVSVGALCALTVLSSFSPTQATEENQAREEKTLRQPEYVPVKENFSRVQTDAAFRSEYHYAPVFQPVENQCANVGHGDWARVTCWTDDGDNLIVRVEFTHRRVKPVGVYIKDDTADTPSGGQVKFFDGRNKRFFEIPQQNRTAQGNPYIIFNYEKFRSESFWIEAVDNLNDRYADFILTVNRNVNRESDADPVVARQAVTYEQQFYRLSQPLQFEKIVEVDGKIKAVYSMVNAVEAEASKVESIEVWPVDENEFTWRRDPGVWAPYVELPRRSNTCDSRNIDVPRVSKMGVSPLVYTSSSTEYPLVRNGAKTSIMVDVKPGFERLQYETWMEGCIKGIPPRAGQARPYQGQLVMPPYARIGVRKELGSFAAGKVGAAQEFGGTISYPSGAVTSTFVDPSRWTSASPGGGSYDWSGVRQWSYKAGKIDWATVANGTWNSPLLPADATVTVSENAPEAVEGAAWQTSLPEPIKVGREKITNMFDAQTQKLAIGKEKSAVNTGNTVVLDKKCLTEEEREGLKGASEAKVDASKGFPVASVVNELVVADCPPAPQPTPTTPEPTPTTPEPTPTAPEPTPTAPEPTPTTSQTVVTQVPSAPGKTPPLKVRGVSKKLAWTGVDVTVLGAFALVFSVAGLSALRLRRRNDAQV